MSSFTSFTILKNNLVWQTTGVSYRTGMWGQSGVLLHSTLSFSEPGLGQNVSGMAVHHSSPQDPCYYSENESLGSASNGGKLNKSQHSAPQFPTGDTGTRSQDPQ